MYSFSYSQFINIKEFWSKMSSHMIRCSPCLCFHTCPHWLMGISGRKCFPMLTWNLNSATKSSDLKLLCWIRGNTGFLQAFLWLGYSFPPQWLIWISMQVNLIYSSNTVEHQNKYKVYFLLFLQMYLLFANMFHVVSPSLPDLYKIFYIQPSLSTCYLAQISSTDTQWVHFTVNRSMS